jgi:hypothetical protein
VFDDGFHRRLWIKAAGPQRAKAGEFQAISANVDGSNGVAKASEDSNYLFFPYIAVASALGEIPLELWLIVKGVNVQRWNEQASRAVE